MDMVKENEAFLPDLPNEKSGDQLVFEQKVFQANEAFKRVHQSIINWFLSPQERRVYPKIAANNKNAFHVRNVKAMCMMRQNLYCTRKCHVQME